MWRRWLGLDDKGKTAVQDTFADNTPKVDDKKQPVFKTQDCRVAADDLDKAKNTNAVELASLTALGVGVSDPYPAWKADDEQGQYDRAGRQGNP